MAGTAWTRKFERAQQDEQFRAWVAMNEAVVELEFEVEEVPELPAAPWGADALDVAERAALRRFPDRQVFAPEHQQSAWRYVRFLGQVYVDAFEGRWVALPDQAGVSQPAVDLPFRQTYREPIADLTAAMARRTGTEWSTAFRYAEEDHQAWVAAGRPPAT